MRLIWFRSSRAYCGLADDLPMSCEKQCRAGMRSRSLHLTECARSHLSSFVIAKICPPVRLGGTQPLPRRRAACWVAKLAKDDGVSLSLNPLCMARVPFFIVFVFTPRLTFLLSTGKRIFSTIVRFLIKRFTVRFPSMQQADFRTPFLERLQPTQFRPRSPGLPQVQRAHEAFAFPPEIVGCPQARRSLSGSPE